MNTVNNNSCIKNNIKPTQHNMQTLHCVSAVGEGYTEDFLKVGSACEGITNGQSIITNNEPTQKIVSLAVDYIKDTKLNNNNNMVVKSPLLNLDLNTFLTEEHYKNFLKENNFSIREEHRCNTRNKVKCYKLNSAEKEQDNSTCNDISMDKLSREMYSKYKNISDPSSPDYISPKYFMQNYRAGQLYSD